MAARDVRAAGDMCDIAVCGLPEDDRKQASKKKR